MTASEVLDRYGTWRLLAFTVSLVLFLVVHLTRLPFLFVTHVLGATLARVDHMVTTSVSQPGTRAGGHATRGG